VTTATAGFAAFVVPAGTLYVLVLERRLGEIRKQGRRRNQKFSCTYMFVLRTLAVGLVLLALTACGSIHPTVPAEQQPIPWLPLTANLTAPSVPSPQPYPVPPGTPACTGRGLVAVVAGSQGATGHVVTSISFSGTGASACFLDGTPHVMLLDAGGHDLAFTQRAPYFPAAVLGPAMVEPGPAPDPHTALKVGQASLTIDWVSQPEACLGQAPASVAGARIGILGGGAVTIQIASVPAGYACQGVGVSSFEGPSMPVETSPPPALPEAVVDAPNSAKAGKQYRYTVTLSNTTTAPMDLVANCPNYFEALMTAAGLSVTGKQFYQLNCAPAGTLAAARAATFEIKLDVPADVPYGAYSLTFVLGWGNAFSKSTSPPVQVTVS